MIEIQGGRLYPNKILRAIGDRTIDPEYGHLDVLTGLCVSSENDTVWGVEPLDDWAFRLAENARQFSIDLHFRVIIYHDLKRDRRASRVETSDSCRDRDIDPVPVEADFRGGPALVERRRVDCLPRGIVEVGDSCVGRVVVRFRWCATEL